MLPTLTLGSWTISTYGLAQALALLLAAGWIFLRLAAAGVRPERAANGVLLVAVTAELAAVGLRGGWAWLLSAWKGDDAAWPGGSSYLPGLLVGVGLFLYYFRRQGLGLRRLLDTAVLPLPLAQAVGRLGCLAAGCCYGRPANGWPAWFLPDEHGVWALRYPTQLMAAAADLAIFLILAGLERLGARPGRLFQIYLLLFCLKRFGLEGLRGDGLPLAGGLTSAALLTGAGFLFALGWLALDGWRDRRSRLRGRVEPA